ncbi:MAG: hypothetical protein GW886_00480 [Rhodobacterales bacterium]|nr:hypothetical protein [Rhodobacterales bacterium]
MCIKGLAEQDVRTRLSDNLMMGGFVKGDTLGNGYTAYCNGRTDIEAFILASDHTTSISLRRR